MISARTFGVLAAVGMTVAVMGYVAWDGALWDPRFQVALHVAGVVMAAGHAVDARGRRSPASLADRGADRAAAAGLRHRLIDAVERRADRPGAGGDLGIVLVLPAAAIAIRHRPTLTALAVALPVLVLAVLTLWGMVDRRLDWVAVGGPGLPPIRLARETTDFGSVAVAPFVLLALTAARPAHRRPASAAGSAGRAGRARRSADVLSGSRSAWIAMGAAAVVLVAPWVVRQSRRGLGALRPAVSVRWTPRRVGLIFLAAAGLALAVAAVGSRLTDLRSLLYRGFLWRDTLERVERRIPLFGIGPGSMPYARQAAAPPLSFPVRQPHSHDIPLGILGDAGVLGAGGGPAPGRHLRHAGRPVADADAPRPRSIRGAGRLRGGHAVRGPHLSAGLQPAGRARSLRWP